MRCGRKKAKATGLRAARAGRWAGWGDAAPGTCGSSNMMVMLRVGTAAQKRGQPLGLVSMSTSSRCIHAGGVQGGPSDATWCLPLHALISICIRKIIASMASLSLHRHECLQQNWVFKQRFD